MTQGTASSSTDTGTAWHSASMAAGSVRRAGIGHPGPLQNCDSAAAAPTTHLHIQAASGHAGVHIDGVCCLQGQGAVRRVNGERRASLSAGDGSGAVQRRRACHVKASASDGLERAGALCESRSRKPGSAGIVRRCGMQAATRTQTAAPQHTSRQQPQNTVLALLAWHGSMWASGIQAPCTCVAAPAGLQTHRHFQAVDRGGSIHIDRVGGLQGQ